ncbi:hypothetical protein K1X12_11410 [Hyphomonas sp. WL0036]|uniref:hypothetical protein n=1 Tax=Hyphomonas sediminis TaxID=2866160 RepID=UPI001C81F2F6|nr:hypothetical protein [Hyphomonas sediminis]MBY9067512.1 hypothetical protein [Hyphomonas sediminis]
MRSPLLTRPAPFAGGYRPARHTLDRIAILNNSGHTPGNRSHLIALLADQWRASGIEVVELSGTSSFVEADLLFLHLSRPIVPEEYRRFAAQYPVTYNTSATDLRKHQYADGILAAGDFYKGAVIVKSDCSYAAPAQPAPSRGGILSNFGLLNRSFAGKEARAPVNDNYHIYPSVAHVPQEKFGKDHIIQKFLPEQNDGRFVLRQYYFLGDRHFLALQTSGAAIIRSAAPLSLEEWTPPQELLDLRARLNLDYGRIDFVQQEGRPFVISVSRSPALPSSKEEGYVPPAYNRLAEAFSEALVENYSTTEKCVF